MYNRSCRYFMKSNKGDLCQDGIIRNMKYNGIVNLQILEVLFMRPLFAGSKNN